MTSSRRHFLSQTIRLVIFALAVTSLNAKEPTFVVRGPTIIAFYPPVSKKAMKDGDEALADFEFYTGAAQKTLAALGVQVKLAFARSFRVTLDGTTTTFRLRASSHDKFCGYYLIAPGKMPRVEYGVDTTINQTAAEYFGIKLP
jgi:hypothetical protein